MEPNNIQAKFKAYAQKYPVYDRNTLVDMMVKDGVITADVAKQIKSGKSLFLIDNSFAQQTQTSDFSMTNIMGGSFSTQSAKTTATPQPTAPQATRKPSIRISSLYLTPNGKIDLNQFSQEALKTKYPYDQYTISTAKNDYGIKTITITNKKSKQTEATIGYGENNFYYDKYQNGKRLTSNVINKLGNITSVCKYNGNQKHLKVWGEDGLTLKYERFSDSTKTIEKVFENGQLATYSTGTKKASDMDYSNFKTTHYAGGKPWKISTINGIKYPLADDLSKDLYSDSYFGKPVINKAVIANIKKCITPENFEEISKAYQKKTDSNLLDDIEKSHGLDQKTKDELKTHLMKMAYSTYDKTKTRSSQVKNGFYKGGNYTITSKFGKTTVVDNSTGKKHTLDLDKMLSKLPDAEQAKTLKMMQNLPAEVLIDLSVEINKKINDGKNIGMKNAAAFYTPDDNEITLGVNRPIYDNAEIFVHELGHAIDYNGVILNTAGSTDGNMKKVFEKELKAYLAKGYKQSEGAGRKSTVILNGKKQSSYATTDEQEMFAECYTLMMLGDCKSKEVITKFFPETFNAAKKLLAEIRNKPNIVRNSPAARNPNAVF